MAINCKDTPTSLGLLILRVGVGVFMAMHGWAKLQGLIDGKFDIVGDPIGIGPQASAIGIVAAEFGCAILIILGLLTRLGGFGIAFAMGVAIFVAHADDAWFMTPENLGKNKESAMLFFIPALALIFTGAGRFSLDALLFKRWCRVSDKTSGEFVSRA